MKLLDLRRSAIRQVVDMMEGGCFCGALRFKAELEAVEAGYCHCSICRKTTGAPFLAFASFPIGGFSYIKGEPTIFKSSSTGHREFCNICGTQICFRRANNPMTVDVNSGALDDVDQVPPNHHIFVSSKVRWVRLDDDLEKHELGRNKVKAS